MSIRAKSGRVAVFAPDDQRTQAHPSEMEERAREAGVDTETLLRTLSALDPADRAPLCRMICDDLSNLASQLVQQMRRDRRDPAIRVAHQIVSLSGTVGAVDLHEAAQDLQDGLRSERADDLKALASEVEERCRDLCAYLSEVPQRLPGTMQA